MKHHLYVVAIVISMLVVPAESLAIGGRGGGGGFSGGGARGGGGFGGGGARGGGGFSGGAARGGGNLGGGASRIGGGGAGGARPPTSAPSLGGASRPDISRPQVQPGIQKPSGGNIGRPGAGQLPSTRPGGGLSPSTRPSVPNINRPGTGSGGTRPSTLPAGRPDLGNRPSTSLPNLGGGGLPGINRPDIGNRPGAGGRPDLGNRPGGNLPGAGGRPTPGDLGDFLGMDRPLRPDAGRPSTLPARPDERPSTLPARPGDRPSTLPARPGGHPGVADRPAVDNRPNIGDRNRWNNNTVINNRPQWANMSRTTNINIHNNWNSAFVNPRHAGWWNVPAGRVGYWHGWANGVRTGWRYYPYRGSWFTAGWWGNHYCPIGGWHYHYWNHNYPYRYWWTVPAWGALTSWFTWSAPATVWQQPVYYDYGSGGNVVYQDNSVYIGGTEVATADQFAQSAMDLATVAPPESEEQAAQAEWMPLGTFAVSKDKQDTQPSQVLQLAVSKEGIISGTLYNTETDQTQAVQGQVDKDTQRVAFRIGESDTIVVETGLYNLTQEEAPVLVHFGTDRTEDWLLVRLDAPDESSDQQQ